MPTFGQFRVLSCMLILVALAFAYSDPAAGATANSVVGADVLVAVTLGTGGCNPGVAGTTSFGSLAAGTNTVASGDCHLTWSTNAPSAMLRMFQSDGVGRTMTSASSSFPDYDQGVDDWSTGNGHFGVCLRAKGATTTADWLLDAACPTTDLGHWNGIPSTATDLGARVGSSDSDGEVRLRFGLRTPTGQLAEAYSAGVTFEVIAPDPGPGAAPTAGTATASGTATIGQTLTAVPAGWGMGTPAGSYTYQWVRCGTGGSTCVDIAGQTASTYVVTGTDGGRTIRVRIAVANMYGSASATSNQTSVVPDVIGDEGGTTNVSGSNVSNLTVLPPAGTFEGDLMIVQLAVRGGTDVDYSTPGNVPAGWTELRRTDNSDRIMNATFYKIAGAAEPLDYTWFWTGSSDRATIAMRSYSAVDPAVPIEASSGGTGTSATSSAPSVTSTRANTLLLALDATRDSVAFTDNNAMTQLWQLAGGGGNVGSFGRSQTVGVGATGVRTAGLSISTRWASQLVLINQRP